MAPAQQFAPAAQSNYRPTTINNCSARHPKRAKKKIIRAGKLQLPGARAFF
jgi:hypothetical protein